MNIEQYIEHYFKGSFEISFIFFLATKWIMKWQTVSLAAITILCVISRYVTRRLRSHLNLSA